MQAEKEKFVPLARLLEICSWQDPVNEKCSETNEIFSAAVDNQWTHLETDVKRYYNPDSAIHTFYRGETGYVKAHVAGRECRMINEPSNLATIFEHIQSGLSKNGHVSISLTPSDRVDHLFELCQTEDGKYYIADSYVGVRPPQVYPVSLQDVLNLVENPTLADWNRIFQVSDTQRDWNETNSKNGYWIEVQYVDK